jgi:hypothetical protein
MEWQMERSEFRFKHFREQFSQHSEGIREIYKHQRLNGCTTFGEDEDVPEGIPMETAEGYKDDLSQMQISSKFSQMQDL